MKSLPTLTLLLLFALGLSAQTSEEEYLYVTFGYQEQLNKGLDDKKGYRWEPLTDYKFSSSSGVVGFRKQNSGQILFEGLYRDGEDKPAAIVVIYKEKESMKKKDGVFFAIPHNDSGTDIKDKARVYFEDEVDFDKGVLVNYALALGKLSMTLAEGGGIKTQTPVAEGQ